MSKILTITLALLFAIAGIGLMCAPAKAATLNVVGGQLMGAQNVNVGGTFYDVTFGNGKCIDLFSGCDNPATDFAFTTQGDAVTAAQALLDQVFLDGGSGNFDSQPILTNGCINDTPCLAYIPWGVDAPLTVFAEYAQNSSTEASDLANPTGSSAVNNILLSDEKTWAVFTPAAIPLPPALLLFLSGLVAFFGVSRYGKSSKAAA